MITDRSRDHIRKQVRARFAEVAQKSHSCCKGSCCRSTSLSRAGLSSHLGYTSDELSAVPDGADMGLGCGNPQAIAEMKEGETVLDLGCGGGFDCFLASKKVGSEGKVIGVDMTPEMVEKARANASKSHYPNVDFRLGEIEHLPVADNSVDIIISNCVINLSPEKEQVFRESLRVLRPGGRLAISDVVAISPLPGKVQQDMDLYSSCVAGAALVDDIKQMASEAGFSEISVTVKEDSSRFIGDWFPGKGLEKYIRSAVITAVK